MVQWQPVHETTPELADELIEKMARFVQRYGAEVPAVFFLELSKPVSFVAGSAVHMATPFLGTFFASDDTFTDFANVMSDRRLLEKFICRIEELAKESDNQKRSDRHQ